MKINKKINKKNVIKNIQPRYEFSWLCIVSISINKNVSRSQKLNERELGFLLF